MVCRSVKGGWEMRGAGRVGERWSGWEMAGAGWVGDGLFRSRVGGLWEIDLTKASCTYVLDLLC